MPPTTGFWLPNFHPDADALLLSGLLLALYGATIWEARRTGIGYPVGGARVGAFLGGALTVAVAGSWPVHDLSEGYLFSVHMAQHMLFTFVAAPLLLWGIPTWLLESAIDPPVVRRVVRFCVSPLVAFVLYNGGVGITHVPEITDIILRNHPIHYLVHVYLMASSMLLWFPVLRSLPGLPRLSYPLQLMYLLLQSIVPTVVYAPLTFSQDVAYGFYGEAPRIWGVDAITDQQMAGLLMKIGGGLIIWGWMTAIFFRWFARSDSGSLTHEFAPLEELTPKSALQAADDLLRTKPDRRRR